jgi:ribosomal protein L7/L12
MSISREAKKEVERFLREGRKIAAIKHLRDYYGLSLSQSKVIVEDLEQNGDDGPVAASFPDGSPNADEILKAEIKRLLAGGKKIQAIKLAKDTLRIRLNGAKVWVDDIEREMNPNHRPLHGVARPYRTGATGRALHSGAGGILMGAFIALGLLFMGGATYVYLRQSQSIQQSDLIKGKVVSMQQNNEGMSAPVIAYEWHGTKRVYSSKTYSSPPAFSVDEEVPVYVNRQDPDNITVDTFSERWLLMFILSVLGAFFVGIPLLIMYFTTRG